MGPRVVVIDNYDSFTYNLVQPLGVLGCELVVHRNDAIDAAGVAAARTRRDRALARSRPARGRRRDRAGRRRARRAVPILGRVPRAPGDLPGLWRVDRGRARDRARQAERGAPRRDRALRRRARPLRRRPLPLAWSPTEPRLPDVLEVTAWTDDVVMGVRHRTLRRRGRPVPPRVGPHRRGAAPTCELCGVGVLAVLVPGRAPSPGRHRTQSRPSPLPTRSSRCPGRSSPSSDRCSRS